MKSKTIRRYSSSKPTDSYQKGKKIISADGRMKRRERSISKNENSQIYSWINYSVP